MKPLLLISLALILLLLAAGCAGESRVGKIVPCSNYHIITEKYRVMDNGGNIHYIVEDTSGNTFQVFVPNILPIGSISPEAYWEEVPIGVQGLFGGQMGGGRTLMSLIPENVTPLSEGNNFCEVVP